MRLIVFHRYLLHLLFILFFLCGYPVYAQDEITAEIIASWRTAAERGDVICQNNLGFCYERGNGVTKNAAEAVKWYRKAAEQGYELAQYNLGFCYERGNGVTKNAAEAVKWYRKAAEQGYASAQNSLGVSYDKGSGVAKNAGEAVKWYRMAAAQSDAMAQFNLGNAYINGEGTTKNASEAVKWYRKAAEQGYASAQNNLGACLSIGEGVAKNDIEAYKWKLLAAAQGNETAKKSVLRDERLLSPAQRSEGQRLAQEWEMRHTTRVTFREEKPRSPVEFAEPQPKITGTGFFITRNGYLVTNNHVVKDCGKVRVQTASGLLDAVLVRADAATDLALLKVPGSFEALPVLSSRTARLGAMVATVGFPNIGLQGFEPKLSKGDISSLTGLHDDVRHFQISVPVQPGNSGGALVDERGNVVGIVTSQLSQRAALENTGTLAQNVNYAVKSSYLLSFLESFPEAHKEVPDIKNNQQKFESVVDDVKKATVLIIGY